VISSTDNIIPGNCPGNYAIARIWTATDDCQNSTTCVQTITVQDVTPPSIACPTNTIINCEDPQVPANTGTASATDLCDTAPVVTFSDNPVPGNCLGNYAIERTWIATDNCGNSNTCLQVIGVQDIAAPTIVCPANTTVNCEGTTPAFAGTATASDNCDTAPTVTFGDQSTQTNVGACTDQTYTITRTWSAVDDCGNSTFCQQIIAVQDTTRPSIICPLNITINCEIDPLPINTGTAIASDNCDPDPGLNHLDVVTPGNCPQEKVIRRRWIAVDNCANANLCEQFITVQDTTKPVLALPANVTINCNDDQTPNGPSGFATATDNCTNSPAVTFADNVLPGSCAQAKTIQRTWTATDQCGNFTSALQIIIVQDVTPPVIQCPTDRTIACNESTDPNVNTALGKAIAIDNCDPAPSVTYIDTKTQFGPCLRDTIITRTWTALDNCNNLALCIQTITKKDTQGPVVVCPADTVINCNTSIAPVYLGFATATDNCGTVTMPIHNDDVVPGNCPQESVIIRTWTSEDDCGNIGICEQTITVQDTTRPFVVTPATIDIECSTDLPLAATTIAEFLALPGTSASDNCSPTANLTVSSTSNFVSGNECNGVIERYYVITDECGNATSVTQTITVTDNTAPIIACPNPITINCQDSQLPANTGSATATDNCSTTPVISSTDNIIPGNCPGNYAIARIWTATDDCQNSTTCVQTITVQDVTPPSIACPTNTIINCEDPQVPANTGTAFATDLCDTAPVVTFSDNPVSGNCLGNYAIERTWIATDNCGNSNTCLQVIGVQDIAAPTIVCPANTTVNCEGTTPAFAGTATASDNCDATPTVTFGDQSTQTNIGACTDQTYTITRTWTAVDDCGNSTFCQQVIAVQDTTRPSIICPLDITINCEVDPLPINTGTAIASDNCDPDPGLTPLDVVIPGDCPQEKVIRRRWVTVDNCANINACEQIITVQDTTKPVLVCPANVTVNCNDDQTPNGRPALLLRPTTVRTARRSPSPITFCRVVVHKPKRSSAPGLPRMPAVMPPPACKSLRCRT
jgi:large repetitive protein